MERSWLSSEMRMASKETIAKSLEGTWLPEQLAVLRRQLADWDHVQMQMAACDGDLAALMKELPAAEVKPVDPGLAVAGKTGKRKRKKNQPNFDLETELKRVAGVDLTRMDGIQVMTVQTVIAEAGLEHEPVADRASLRVLDRVGSPP
jgi:transposase